MMRGRKPKPSHLKAIQGNAGKRAINRDEPKSTSLDEIPEPPIWLYEIAQEAWRHLAPWLVDTKILTSSDLHNLEAFCQAYARWRMAEADIGLNGLVVDGAMGGKIKNPACTVVNEALKQMATFGSALGLDPSSRSRLAVPGAEEKNPFEALLGGASKRK